MKNKFLKFITPFTIWMGGLKMPWVSNNTFLYEYHLLVDTLIVGDAILTKSNWYISNIFNKLLNPGKYMHVAMYVGKLDGKHSIVEAIGEGVISRPLSEFLADKDVIAIRSPRRALPSLLYRVKACVWIIEQVGKPYDYQFDIENEDSLYCSEAYYASIKHSFPSSGFVRKYANAKKWLPNDVYKANKFFTTTYEKKK